MKRKILGILICMMLVATTYVIVPDNSNVKAIGGGGGPAGDIGLDLSFIKNFSQMLSNVTYDAYEKNELAKGRDFGTKGEWYAKDKIRENMTDLGLRNVTVEQIENISSLIGENLPGLNLTYYQWE